MNNSYSRRATLLIISAAILWGLIGPFSVWANRAGLRPVEIAFWRAALASVPFALLLARKRPSAAPRDWAGVAFFGAAGIAVMYGAFFTAVEKSGAGIAAVLLYTGPAWVAVFDTLIARRLPSGRTVGALLLTVSGVVLLSYDPRELVRANAEGILFGLLSGIAFSTHFTVAPRYITRLGAPFVYAVAMVVAAILLSALARPSLPAAAALPPLLFLALVATFAASLLFARGVIHVPPVRAAITATIEPVVAVVVAMLVLGATLQLLQLIGAALVLGGVTVILLRPRAEADGHELAA